MIVDFFYFVPGVQPSPYAVYRFFDFNDHDTTIVSNSNSPEFNDAYVYPVVMTAELDNYLKNDVSLDNVLLPYLLLHVQPQQPNVA